VVLASTFKNDSLVFVPFGSGSGSDQLWSFGTTKRQNRYRLQTVAKSEFNAVDISSYSGQNSITAHFVAVEENTGQFWALDKWDDGSVRITNDFTGPDIRLGVDSNGMPGILGGDSKGSHWTLSRFGGTVQTVSVSGTVSTIIVAPTTLSTSVTSAPTAEPTNEPTKIPDHTKKLSTGAIVGISVGGVVALVAIILIIILWRKKSTGSTSLQNASKQDAMTSYPVLSRDN